MSSSSIYIGIIFLVLIGFAAYVATVHLTNYNCTGIDSASCTKALDKKFKVIPIAAYESLEKKQASKDTCSSLSGYKLLSQTDFSKMESNQATTSNCSNLEGHKLLTSSSYDTLVKNQANETSCASLSGYKLVTQTDYNTLVEQSQVKPTNSPFKFLVQSDGASGKCLTVKEGGIDGNNVSFTDCDETGGNVNQVFTYDTYTNTIKNAKGQCLDDGGVTGDGSGKWYFNQNCSSIDWDTKSQKINNNQLFRYWPGEFRWENAAKNLCLDANNGVKLHYWRCINGNPNQRWKIVDVKTN